MAELWSQYPPLAGDAVVLRPWGDADVPGIVAAFSDPVMQRFSWRTTPYTETDARDYFAEQEHARSRGEGLNFALVEPRDQDVVLGNVALRLASIRAARRSGTGSPQGSRPGACDRCGPAARPVGIR